MLTKARHIILGIIDFCHRPFIGIIPLQTFRYLACGGTNTVLNIAIYSLSLKYVIHNQDIHVYENFKITSRVAAYIIAFCISFPIGFILSRHIVFPESNLHGRIQFFRYAMATATFILLNYVMIKFFDLYAHMIPATISYTFITIILAVLSYISQRKFTFKVKEEEVIAD